MRLKNYVCFSFGIWISLLSRFATTQDDWWYWNWKKGNKKKIEKGRYPAPWFYKWIFILQFFLMGNSIHCTDGRTNDRNTYLFARPGLCKFLGCFQIYYCHFRLCSSHFLLCDRRSFLESISMHFCYAFEQAFNKVIY